MLQKWSNWWDDTEEDQYGELDINTTGALKLARIATRELVKHRKKGVVLITASLAGYMVSQSGGSKNVC